VEERRCLGCGGTGPFHKKQSRCALCVKQRSREYYRAHSTRIKQRVLQKYKENSLTSEQIEQRRKASRHYAEQHPDRILASVLHWQRSHPERHRLLQATHSSRRRANKARVLGTLTADEWREILVYFNHACAYCLRTDLPLTQDHIIPLSRGGSDTKENVVPACSSCNSRKKDRPIFVMLPRRSCGMLATKERSA
jgi:5-methylcytosine-specific restriction endonuclease McrA